MENWKLPEEYGLVYDPFRVVAIVKLKIVKKYYENLGYSFLEYEDYSDQMYRSANDDDPYYHFPEVEAAREIVGALGYDYGEILIPSNEGIALLPFGHDYAVAIAPRLPTELPDTDALPIEPIAKDGED